ncbi:hypothetical protein, conserved [Angomonas deanei]|uniref:Mpv17 / PMP22 family n=1 Tax=Angomonas deanei TaxID=59799 RepID=A0A7G2CJD4_9TRYP|nr:hypothetical protein, conserved [Angomonas deanei]
MSTYVKRGLAGAAVWGVGDLLAQMYAAHKESAARRARGEKRSGPRPTGAQMASMVDQESIAYSLAFGGAAGLFMHYNYNVVLPRVFKTFARSTSNCVGGLFMQQFIFTPLILVSYFNFMTAVRGGFSDMSFMDAHFPKQRHDVLSIEQHLFASVMPFPLVCSWGIFAPLYIRLFFGGVTGGLEKFIFTTLFVPWAAVMCHSQRALLL